MDYPNYPGGNDPAARDVPRFGWRHLVLVIVVVLIVTVATYRAFFGWHQVDDPAPWRSWTVAAVLAVLAAWYGWLGFPLAGSIAATITMSVVTTVDGATAPDLGGDGFWWPLAWLFAAVPTAVVVFLVSELVDGLRRRQQKRKA